MSTTETSKSNIKVSVILPVYEVEDYIDKCIESLKAQTLCELEFIFVDDCGTDDSMRAVETFASEDSRVHIIRNSCNLGAGPSRNVGIEAAQGEYLSFIDPDDYLADDFYDLLYKRGMVTQADIIKGVRIEVESSNALQSSKTEKHNRMHADLNNRIRKSHQHKVPLFCVFTAEHQSAIYSHYLFDNPSVRYGTTSNAEDTTFLLRACLQKPSINLENRAIYYYRQRKASATESFSKKRAFEELFSFYEKLDTVQDLQELSPKNGYAEPYLNRMLSAYYSNACESRYQEEWNGDEVEKYEQGLKELIRKMEQRWPRYAKFLSQAAELCAVREYGVWIPRKNNKYAVSRREVLEAWISFLTKNPSASEIYIRGFDQSLIRAFASAIITENAKEAKFSLKRIRLQLKRLNVKQRRAVILEMPFSALLLLQRKIGYLVYGFSK